MNQSSFSRAVVFFQISSVRYVLFWGFWRAYRVILLSVNILTVGGVLLLSFIVSNARNALIIAVCSVIYCCLLGLIIWAHIVEFVLDLLRKFTLYVYGDSRTDSVFMFASVCMYLDWVICQLVLVANSYCFSRMSPVLLFSLVVQTFVLLVLSNSLYAGWFFCFISIGVLPVITQSPSLEVVR
jgi:hypothetical protein